MQFHPHKKKLLRQMAEGRFRSGAELAETLGISRTAVWKHLEAFDELGLELLRVRGRGYRLAEPLELLDEETLLAALSVPARACLAALELHDELDSTNTRLMQTARETGGHGIVCLAERQSAGRGRSGRNWVSPFAANLYLSVLWRFEEGHGAAAGISLAVGVAVARAVRRCGLEGVGLKWPNDLLWQERKLGGILVEATGESHGPCSVVIGVGLNVHMSAAAGSGIDQPWVDCREVAGRRVSRNQLAAALLDELLPLLRDYPATGLARHLPAWREHSCMLGRPVVLRLGDARIHGVAEEVGADGLLYLRLENGERRTFASGEVHLRLAQAGGA
ncbi:MAG TPA: bifunctional biotin--[acetyl-CoA-carboxylase] ligase/biotin operon repressor BirA [Methylococcaceae bacterium]|nr:bifunctional biotin--[acetyl-CoA-carboxylase] ligase/biotin operon repressor BirA [Methylococcaceae bacterium]